VNDCGRTPDEECPVTITCLPEPCVSVVCEAPAAACDDEEITVSGTATNCSAGAEDITITINGPGGVIGSMLFEDVPAGESRTHEESFIHSCGAPEPELLKSDGTRLAPRATTTDDVVAYNATAVATNVCGEDRAESEPCLVDCKPEPCLELVCDGPLEACDGDEVTVSGTATNCSLGAEDITITISGPGGQLATQTYTDVPAGESRTLEATDTFACAEAGQQVGYTVVAYAENDCGRTPDEECPVTITCQPEPCVELVCNGPADACDGDEVTISGTATNCSAGPEDITIVISGPAGQIGTQTYLDVPAGESRTLQATDTFSCAEAGQQVGYTVVAYAENDCGRTPDEDCQVSGTPRSARANLR
jgi:hypothetical protein